MEKKHYLVIGNDTNGRDELVGTFTSVSKAKKIFDELVSEGISYVRYESVDVIGGNKEDGFEYDNNDTIESYYDEDYD